MRDDGSGADAATRELLRLAGAREDAPRVNVARDAVARIRGRRRATGNLNELFRIVHHLLGGLSKIFGSPPPDDDRRTPRT